MRTFITALLFVCSLAVAQDRSDFETVRSFEQKTKAVTKAIEAAQTVQECADISVTIQAIQDEFAKDKALLDKALYGEKFDERVMRLRVQLKLSQDKLGIIESQVTRIADLETQVRTLSAKVDELSGANAKLMADVDRLSSNIKSLGASNAASGAVIDSLNNVIGQLQKGIKDRDAMIFALVDSLFMQYNKEFAQMGDTDKRGLSMRLDRNNVVASVKMSIEHNLQFLDRAELKGGDLAEILKEQAKFSSQWKGLGPKLTSLYMSNKARAKELALIDTMLAAWSTKAGEAVWRGLNATFTANTLAVQPVSNGGDVVRNLTAYIDAQIALPGDQRAKSYQAFEKVWNADLKTGWLPLLEQRGDISAEQRNAIEAKAEEFANAVAPTSPVIYLAIFVAIVAILAVLYTRMRKRP